jgi:hypothetical protein
MAKILNFPTLHKLTDQEKNEFLIQLFEMRDKLTNVVDLISDQQMTNDLRERLNNEMMAVQSMLTNADEMVRSAYTLKK